MLIDSHCHLNLIDLSLYQGSLDAVIDEAKNVGVEHMLCVAVDVKAYSELHSIATLYPNVSISVGVHPNEQCEKEITVKELVDLASDPLVIAIGETGLDYYRSEGDTEWQRERFRTHIRAAKEINKPLIIHTRQAREDTLQILQEENAQEVGGVMHCFTESWELAKQAMDLNFYVSLAGIVTFPNAKEVKELAKKIPLDRLLIETDSPYLAPVPHRGKPNCPAFVRYVAAHIAELRQVSFEKIAEQTTANFYNLFKLGSVVNSLD